MTTPTIIQNSALYFAQHNKAPKTETALFRKLWGLDKDKRGRLEQLRFGLDFIMPRVRRDLGE